MQKEGVCFVYLIYFELVNVVCELVVLWYTVDSWGDLGCWSNEWERRSVASTVGAVSKCRGGLLLLLVYLIWIKCGLIVKGLIKLRGMWPVSHGLHWIRRQPMAHHVLAKGATIAGSLSKGNLTVERWSAHRLPATITLAPQKKLIWGHAIDWYGVPQGLKPSMQSHYSWVLLLDGDSSDRLIGTNISRRSDRCSYTHQGIPRKVLWICKLMMIPAGHRSLFHWQTVVLYWNCTWACPPLEIH
jgi:hypothetical protein